MRKIFITLSVALISMWLMGQNENPYSQFGYEAPIMPDKKPSLENPSFFVIPNSDTSSMISFLSLDIKNRLFSLHSKSGEIIEKDTLISYSFARWLTPDPASQYHSPYSGMGNNPINGADPDGRLVIFVNGYMPLEGRYSMNSSELKSYWGGMAGDFKSHLGDYNDVYIDGHTVNPVSSASRRSSMGYEAGKAFQPALQPGETIKIVAHSQGAAYSEGFVKALNENGYSVEVVYALEPYNAGDINFSENQRLIQYHSGRDLIAPYSLLKGADQSFFPREDWFNMSLNYQFQSHLISNLRGWIFNPSERISRFTPSIEVGPIESIGWEYE
jgi:hypothetical protein